MKQRQEFERKTKESLPVVALCYDFDKTLTPDDMQAQGYIQSVGFEVDEFWAEANHFAEEHDMDYILASMFKMKEKAQGQMVFTREKLQEYGSKISLFPGVSTWFQRMKDFGTEHGVLVEHYVISCGMKEMIEGTEIAKQGAFEKIYASSFYYDSYGVAEWPAQLINYTNKTQYLTRIQKGVLQVNDLGVNDFFPPESIRIPFRNMVYIGDSDTDIPCMQVVNANGGHSIGVYDNETKNKEKVHKMMSENRIKYFSPADYTEGSHLDALVKSIIKQTATNEALSNIYFECKAEAMGERAMHSLFNLQKDETLGELGCLAETTPHKE